MPPLTRKTASALRAHIDAAVVGEARIEPDDLPLEAAHGRRVDEGDDDARDERDEDAGVELREQREVRQDRGVENVRQLVGRPGRLEHTRRDVAGQEQRDRVHHQADDELVDAEIDAQERRNRRPQRAAEEGRKHAERDMQRGRQARRRSRRCRRRARPSASAPRRRCSIGRRGKDMATARPVKMSGVVSCSATERFGQPTSPPSIRVA